MELSTARVAGQQIRRAHGQILRRGRPAEQSGRQSPTDIVSHVPIVEFITIEQHEYLLGGNQLMCRIAKVTGQKPREELLITMLRNAIECGSQA